MARRNPVTAKDMFDIALDALKEKRTADAKAVTKEAAEKFPNATVPGALQRFLPPQYDIDKLAVDLGLPTWESVEERNLDYIWESADQRIDATGDEDVDDELRLEMQGEVRDELFCQWYDAVLATGQALFAEAELEIEPIRRGRYKKTANTRDFYLKVAPTGQNTWTDVARYLHDVEGSYSSYRNFLGNDTARGAVMKCLHYLRGGQFNSARTIYDRNWR